MWKQRIRGINLPSWEKHDSHGAQPDSKSTRLTSASHAVSIRAEPIHTGLWGPPSIQHEVLRLSKHRQRPQAPLHRYPGSASTPNSSPASFKNTNLATMGKRDPRPLPRLRSDTKDGYSLFLVLYDSLSKIPGRPEGSPER